MCLSKRWIYSRSIWTDTGSHKSLLGMLPFVLLSVILASIVSIHTIIRIIIMELMIILMNRADPKRNKCYLNLRSFKQFIIDSGMDQIREKCLAS
jgi:hypothetical protein